MKHTRVFDIDNVIDCVGVGDAFCGAMLYAQTAFSDEQKRVNFFNGSIGTEKYHCRRL